jgi:hypothetical protein
MSNVLSLQKLVSTEAEAEAAASWWSNCCNGSTASTHSCCN